MLGKVFALLAPTTKTSDQGACNKSTALAALAAVYRLAEQPEKRLPVATARVLRCGRWPIELGSPANEIVADENLATAHGLAQSFSTESADSPCALVFVPRR
jgi:hypothetical protein